MQENMARVLIVPLHNLSPARVIAEKYILINLLRKYRKKKCYQVVGPEGPDQEQSGERLLGLWWPV